MIKQEAQGKKNEKNDKILVCVRMRPLNIKEASVCKMPAWKPAQNTIYSCNAQGQADASSAYYTFGKK